MIDLYSETTPNGQKIHIMLEETGLDYRTLWVDIDRGEQFEPDFLKISPNNKIPAIVDHDGPGGELLSVFESGAILLYLADMAIFPWCRLHERQGQSLDDFPNVKSWFDRIALRPAVARDMEKLEDVVGEFDEESWSASFGTEQYKRRG